MNRREMILTNMLIRNTRVKSEKLTYSNSKHNNCINDIRTTFLSLKQTPNNLIVSILISKLCCIASLHKKIELVTRNFASTMTTISYIVSLVKYWYWWAAGPWRWVVKKLVKSQSIILGHCNMRFG